MSVGIPVGDYYNLTRASSSFRPSFQIMASKLIVKNWIQRLLPACDGDAGHAKRQLEWLKEKVTLDMSSNSSKSIYSLSKQEQDLLDVYITQRTEQHKPLQYILGMKCLVQC